MASLVKLVRLNGLQYNRNRDPQAYRRGPDEPFRIEALLEGNGPAHCSLTDAAGKVLAAGEVQTPGTWRHELRFPAEGSHLLRLGVKRGQAEYSLDLRLDVVARHHA